jgi:hypothetical protein
MDTLAKLMEISSRLEHLEGVAQWITKETVHTDNVISQSGTLILTIADDLREKVYQIVRELELRGAEGENFH